MIRIDWRITDGEVRAFVNDKEAGVVHNAREDSLFYEAVVGDKVVCTTNLPFEAMRALEDHVMRRFDQASAGKGA